MPTYTTKPNQMLQDTAEEIGNPVSEILKLNPEIDPNTWAIKGMGSVLNVPGSKTTEQIQKELLAEQTIATDKEAKEEIEKAQGTINDFEKIIQVYSPTEKKVFPVPASDISGWLDRGFIPTSDREKEEIGKLGGLTSEEKEAVGITTKETPEEKTLKSELSDIDSQINKYIGQVDALRVSAKDATQSYIDSIKQRMDERRDEMREINERALKTYQTLNIRLGTERYAPGIAGGIITTEEAAGINRLREIDVEEAELIAKAKQALVAEDFELLEKNLELFETRRNEKVSQLEKLQALTFQRNQELVEEKEKIKNQSAIVDLIQQGITDPYNIFDSLSGIVGMDEITDILKSLPEPTEEAIKIFNNIPYKAIRDENGNIVSYEKIPGVETEEDIKTFGGMPYRAVKDKEGNVLKYEQIPGIEITEKSTEGIDSWVDLLAKGQTQIYNIPTNIRTEVISRATERGIKIISPTFAKAAADAIVSFNSASSQLNIIEEQSQKVITATNIFGIPAQAAKGLPGVRLTFPEYKIYQDSIDAFLSMLTRAAGERGVLTNIDVGRIKKALPDLNSDTIYTATEKLKNFRGLLESIKNGSVDAYTALQFGITLKEETSEYSTPGEAPMNEDPLNIK